MKERVKYAVFLAVVVLVSFSTSYITTFALKQNQSNTNTTNNPQQTANTNSTSNVVHALSYQTNFDPSYVNSPDDLDPVYNYVTVATKVAMLNLTITYQYTCLNNGTTLQTKVTYGDFYPSWNGGFEGAPVGVFRIPNYIMNACSSTKNDYQGNPVGWDVYPQLNVTDVSGFA